MRFYTLMRRSKRVFKNWTPSPRPMLGCLACLVMFLMFATLTRPAFADEAQPAPLPLPALTAIIGGAPTDADAYARIAAYYADHRAELQVMFDEADETRLRGLFGMYITHLAAPYNIVPVEPVTLLEFVSTPTAHCGTYALAQSQIYDALGISWRFVLVDRGWHGLIEVLVGRQYETFDATSNVWINLSVGEMMAGMTQNVTGEPRRFRVFYTPSLDPAAAPVYRAHLTNPDCDRCSVPQLRAGVSQWGLLVFPSTWTVERQN